MGDDRIRECLNLLYGTTEGARTWTALTARLDLFRDENHRLAYASAGLAERDAFLITPGDQVTDPDRPPLQSLRAFIEKHLADVLGGVHLLPPFRSAPTDPYSIIDHRQLNPALGTWDEVRRLGWNYRLMVDGVFNHVSRASAAFGGFQKGEKPYTDHFLVLDPATDLSAVARHGAPPVLTAADTAAGPRHVWSTFGDDRVDLNFRNPAVLLEVVDLLLFYAAHGAQVIRLDAVEYLWKEVGTPCVHLPQTHALVKLFRAVLDAVAPGVLLLADTAAPPPDNLRYFGDGTDQAQLLPTYALPPLLLHTFRTGNARVLTDWAMALAPPPPATAYYNFTATADGIGLAAVRNLLAPGDVDALVAATLARGGQVSAATNPGGTESVPELNITYYDALSAPQDPLATNRFLASQFIMLTLAGVPGIYFNSLLGAHNWQAGFTQTGQPRALNRVKHQRTALEADLANSSHTHRVFAGYRQMLRARSSHPAFHPKSSQEILHLSDDVFALRRGENLLAVVNVTDQPLSFTDSVSRRSRDLVTRRRFRGEVPLGPYEFVWLVY